jgi:hypothetical protein
MDDAVTGNNPSTRPCIPGRKSRSKTVRYDKRRFRHKPKRRGLEGPEKIASGLNHIVDGTTFKGTRRTERIAAPKCTLSNTQVGHVTYVSWSTPLILWQYMRRSVCKETAKSHKARFRVTIITGQNGRPECRAQLCPIETCHVQYER